MPPRKGTGRVRAGSPPTASSGTKRRRLGPKGISDGSVIKKEKATVLSGPSPGGGARSTLSAKQRALRRTHAASPGFGGGASTAKSRSRLRGGNTAAAKAQDKARSASAQARQPSFRPAAPAPATSSTASGRSDPHENGDHDTAGARDDAGEESEDWGGTQPFALSQQPPQPHGRVPPSNADGTDASDSDDGPATQPVKPMPDDDPEPATDGVGPASPPADPAAAAAAASVQLFEVAVGVAERKAASAADYRSYRTLMHVHFPGVIPKSNQGNKKPPKRTPRMLAALAGEAKLTPQMAYGNFDIIFFLHFSRISQPHTAHTRRVI